VTIQSGPFVLPHPRASIFSPIQLKVSKFYNIDLVSNVSSSSSLSSPTATAATGNRHAVALDFQTWPKLHQMLLSTPSSWISTFYISNPTQNTQISETLGRRHEFLRRARRRHHPFPTKSTPNDHLLPFIPNICLASSESPQKLSSFKCKLQVLGLKSEDPHKNHPSKILGLFRLEMMCSVCSSQRIDDLYHLEVKTELFIMFKPKLVSFPLFFMFVLCSSSIIWITSYRFLIFCYNHMVHFCFRHLLLFMWFFLFYLI